MIFGKSNGLLVVDGLYRFPVHELPAVGVEIVQLETLHRSSDLGGCSPSGFVTCDSGFPFRDRTHRGRQLGHLYGLW